MLLLLMPLMLLICNWPDADAASPVDAADPVLMPVLMPMLVLLTGAHHSQADGPGHRC